MNSSIKINFFRSVLLFGMVLLTVQSCRRDDQNPSWDMGIYTPLVRTSMGIEHLVADSLLEQQSDSSLLLVYRDHLYNLSLDTLVELNDTGITRSYTLDSISLYDQSLTYPVTLGQICQGAGIIGAVIISQNGNSIPIPAIPSIGSSPYPIDADTLFQTMTLITGFLDITIYNGLPIDITNLQIEIRNNSNNLLVANATFPLIAVGATETQTVSLAGITIEGAMTGQIISMSSPGSNNVPVLIDTTDALMTTLSVYDLHPSSATAIFPAQNIVDKEQTAKFTIKSIELKEAHIKSGQVVVELYSTLQDSVHFTYELPSAELNGVPFEIKTTLPPAAPGGVSSFVKSYDFSGYNLDLSGPNQDTVNTIYNVFKASVDSTGQMKTLSVTDSIYSDMRFVDITPDYARGYLGQDTISAGPSDATISIFNHIIDGTIALDDVNIDVEVTNGIGAEAKLDIVQLTSVNTRTGNVVPLNGSVMSTPLLIPRATDAGGSLPVNSSVTLLNINANNSNANAFVENLPDKIGYHLNLYTNPAGNTANYNDFIYADHLMEIGLNMEVPLALIANSLTLCDTADIDISGNTLENVLGGVMTLIAQNGFPFNTHLQMYTLSAAGLVTDSLLGPNMIPAAPVDGSGKVNGTSEGRLIIPIDPGRLERLKAASQLRIISAFDTQPANTLLKIYSDYKIDFLLTGDFTYRNQ